MKRFSYILCRLAAAPVRWPALFHVACIGAGSILCVKYLRGHATVETVALAILGAAAAVPFAMLCIVISQKAAVRALDEELRREMEKSRKSHEEMLQQRLTKFLEECIEGEGDTPVWKSEHEE